MLWLQFMATVFVVCLLTTKSTISVSFSQKINYLPNPFSNIISSIHPSILWNLLTDFLTKYWSLRELLINCSFSFIFITPYFWTNSFDNCSRLTVKMKAFLFFNGVCKKCNKPILLRFFAQFFRYQSSVYIDVPHTILGKKEYKWEIFNRILLDRIIWSRLQYI